MRALNDCNRHGHGRRRAVKVHDVAKSIVAAGDPAMAHTSDNAHPDHSQTAENAPLVVRSKAFHPSANPDVEVIQRADLRDSQKVRKEASYIRVTDRATGEYHHEALTIKTVKKLKAVEK